MALDTNITVVKLDVLNEALLSKPGQRRSEDVCYRRRVTTDAAGAPLCPAGPRGAAPHAR